MCDNGRFHTTKAVQAWLEANRDQIEVYWLPPYCPSLNLIERLWGHLKRTCLANVLFVTIDDLVAAFRKGVAASTDAGSGWASCSTMTTCSAKKAA